MKHLKFSRMLAIALALGVTMTACNGDDDDDNNNGNATYSISEVTVGGQAYKKIVGNINANLTLDASNKYLLGDGVFVMNGFTLTIPEGTEIYGDKSDGVDFLTINQGAKIMCMGTAANPVVMSALTQEKGSFGGLIINGYGEINNGSTATAECNSGTYGGTDNSDNSGEIHYLRIEYSGFICATDDELNGLTLNAVGSGTTLEYIQVYKGADDGFEWFGGAANLRYAMSTANKDDSFDCTHGWAGKGQFWVVHQDKESGDRGFEFDNNADDNSALPFTNPMIANVTLVGQDDGDSSNTGMRLREGSKFKIWNALVTGFPNHGIRVSDQQTLDNVTAGEAFVSHSSVWGTSYLDGTAFKDCQSFVDNNNCDEATVSLTGFVGTGANGADPSTVDSWFMSNTYRGAVQSSSDWTTGGWARNVDGSIRN